MWAKCDDLYQRIIKIVVACNFISSTGQNIFGEERIK